VRKGKLTSIPILNCIMLSARLQHYKGKDYYPPERGGKVAVPSKEGKAAVQEALAFLEKQVCRETRNDLVDSKLGGDSVHVSIALHQSYSGQGDGT
jgi:hypothetical protein